MDTYILNQATELWLLSDTISKCVALTAEPSDRSVEPGTFNYDIGMYLRDDAIDYIKQHLGFLQKCDVTKVHHVISLLFDPRCTRLNLLVD